ncbi:MAG: hypothetical protein MMC23_007838 [Stictis urceolatum]|nr:hypothetical protein [Stictis urceolata]
MEKNLSNIEKQHLEDKSRLEDRIKPEEQADEEMEKLVEDYQAWAKTAIEIEIKSIKHFFTETLKATADSTKSILKGDDGFQRNHLKRAERMRTHIAFWKKVQFRYKKPVMIKLSLPVTSVFEDRGYTAEGIALSEEIYAKLSDIKAEESNEILEMERKGKRVEFK